MRAARILHLLLLLQNRGRMTSGALADELEVTSRTILRDIDALTEAGLPVIVFQGRDGGVELGFGYRTRLTGLSGDEAEALAVILAHPTPEVHALGLGISARRARSKLLESLPDKVRERVSKAARQFRFAYSGTTFSDDRIPALAEAIRNRRIVVLKTRSQAPVVAHPQALVATDDGWQIDDALSGAMIAASDWGDINISAKSFPPARSGQSC